MIDALDQNARDQGQRVAASPGSYTGAVNEIGQLASKLQAQSPVPQMQSDTEAKMQELFNYDKQLESQYDPLAGQRTSMYGEGVVQHPGAAYGGASKSITAGAGGVGDLFSAMGQYKQLEGTALVNAMNTIFDLIKSRQDREAKEADRVWEREKFERQQALEEKKLGQGIGVSSDVRTTNLLNQVATDAKSGTSLDDIMRKYSTQADPGEILRVYNTNSSWGPAKETVEELYKKYGVTPPTGAPEATGQGGTVIEQINRLPTGAERAGARAVYDLTTVIDEAMKKAEGTPTGPLSALGAQYSKLTGGRGATAQLEPALTEILRTIRKEATGVAFSPQEIKDLQKEVPAIFQQEATVRDNLQRLKQRMTNKLAVYSIVDEGVNNDPLGIR